MVAFGYILILISIMIFGAILDYIPRRLIILVSFCMLFLIVGIFLIVMSYIENKEYIHFRYKSYIDYSNDPNYQHWLIDNPKPTKIEKRHFICLKIFI